MGIGEGSSRDLEQGEGTAIGEGTLCLLAMIWPSRITLSRTRSDIDPKIIGRSRGYERRSMRRRLLPGVASNVRRIAVEAGKGV